MERWKKVFKEKLTVIGMIHVDPLPGSPAYRGNTKDIIQKALTEAEIYKESGIDAVCIENMHDRPYLVREAGPEVISLMSIICYESKNITDLPVGVQVLAGANREALGIAKCSGIDFVRTEGFVFAHIADEGIIEADAGKLLRYRKSIDAEDILILTDIKKKHSSHSITGDIDIVETAKAAEFFMSDGLIITGKSTGEEADPEEARIVKETVNLPLIIGSGISLLNISNYASHADGVIVGSHFKKEGKWYNPLDKNKVKEFMRKIR